MKLLAISDLHLGYEVNRQALEQMTPHLEDWIIVAGDIGARPEHLDLALRVLTARFARVFWVPGNHDLWSPTEMPSPRALRYASLSVQYVRNRRSHPAAPTLMSAISAGPK